MLRNILLTFFDALIVFGMMNLMMYLMPLELSVSGTYFFLMAVGSIHTTREAIARKKGKIFDMPWWVGPVGLGIGIGVWVLRTIPDSSALHIPLLVLASLAVTIMMHTILKRAMKPSR